MLARYLIFFAIIVLIEIYFLQAVRTVSIDFSPNKRRVFLYIFYGLFAINLTLGIVGMFYPPPNWNGIVRMVFSIFFVMALCKLIGVVFLLMDDLVRAFRWIASFLQKAPATETAENAHHISRLKFFSQLAMAFTVIPAFGLVYGIIRGAYKFRVHKATIKSPNLPVAFHGFKIVQISDIHSGSFMSTEPIMKAFNIAMEQKPDIIFFTGDLVNNEVSETTPHLDTYKMLKAPHGVYSTLGNHDYGDYMQWESREAKKKNLEDLKQVHAASGWRLLMNEHVAIEKDGQKIALLGIENWGGNLNFPRYGKLDKAYTGTEDYTFKILLSHDPSHWDKEVKEDPRYRDIDLTLSGHTHGMQLGIEIPGIKWSPSKYFYKQWAGLYRQDNQYLYVNRGLGFLGYPGRLGIWPEITVLELQKA
ncbi:MAG: metallophosphoesterase [Bacteroidetes bacterium]|nr:metallophosphoesterase [Bacteroidota bacterium]